jgi:hypothetical protein
LKVLHLRVLDVRIRVRCADPYSFGLLSTGYGAFVSAADTPQIEYLIDQSEDGAFRIGGGGQPPDTVGDDYELLYAFEKGMTMAVQRLRTDLLFLHAAALEHEGRAVLLIAPSGSGKSTTTWALLSHGLRYMSDELAPIDLETLRVELYPHALCLKAPPPEPFTLPEGSLHTSYTIHVPVTHLPGERAERPVPLAAVFCLRYEPAAPAPSIRPISTAEAAAHIYSNSLNLLAHARYGLDAALTVARNGDCFELVTSDLRRSCELIKSRISH